MASSRTHQKSTLTADFYQRDNVVRIARDLLGKYLCTQIGNDPVSAGMIVETEAYAAHGDQACHASGYNRTERNKAMFQAGGVAYVYLCYGIHHLFNVVTNIAGEPEAVLIRAIQPVDGVDVMRQRRGHERVSPKLTGGPGRLAEALGIDLSHYGTDLRSAPVWIEDRGIRITDNEIETGKRIGVDYAGKDAGKPWRFTIGGNRWTSR